MVTIKISYLLQIVVEYHQEIIGGHFWAMPEKKRRSEDNFGEKEGKTVGNQYR